MPKIGLKNLMLVFKKNYFDAMGVFTKKKSEKKNGLVDERRC